jgi:Phage Terminase
MATLGHGVADWISDHLSSPGDPSRPFVLTDEQVRFLLSWYAVDEVGEFLYRRGAVQMPKGWGKSPLLAAVAIAELAGPVVFDGFDPKGQPLGRPWGTGGSPPPWVQVAAGSEDQANSNVYSLIWEFLTVNDGAAAMALGIDRGRTRLYLKAQPGAKLEAVTSDAGSREGQRVTFAVLDETHLWTKQNGGVRLDRTTRRNAAKMGGRTLECSNAFEPGAGSVAELTATAHELGEAGILYVASRPSIEPTPDMSDERLAALLREVYQGATWVDLPRIVAEVRDPATPWNESLRYFFNLPTAGAGALVDPAQWVSLATNAEPPEGSRVALGFDGSDTHDATALVGCTQDGHLFAIGVWERPAGVTEWRVPRAEVNRSVQWAMEHFTVGRFLCDPWQWRSELEAWAERYGSEVVMEHPTNSIRLFSPAIDRFRVAVAEGELSHDGDSALARHVGNARLRAARGGYVLEKAGPGRLIDACIAAILAFEARAVMPVESDEMPLVAWG